MESRVFRAVLSFFEHSGKTRVEFIFVRQALWREILARKWREWQALSGISGGKDRVHTPMDELSMATGQSAVVGALLTDPVERTHAEFGMELSAPLKPAVNVRKDFPGHVRHDGCGSDLVAPRLKVQGYDGAVCEIRARVDTGVIRSVTVAANQGVVDFDSPRSAKKGMQSQLFITKDDNLWLPKGTKHIHDKYFFFEFIPTLNGELFRTEMIRVKIFANTTGKVPPEATPPPAPGSEAVDSREATNMGVPMVPAVAVPTGAGATLAAAVLTGAGGPLAAPPSAYPGLDPPFIGMAVETPNRPSAALHSEITPLISSTNPSYGKHRSRLSWAHPLPSSTEPPADATYARGTHPAPQTRHLSITTLALGIGMRVRRKALLRNGSAPRVGSGDVILCFGATPRPPTPRGARSLPALGCANAGRSLPAREARAVRSPSANLRTTHTRL